MLGSDDELMATRLDHPLKRLTPRALPVLARENGTGATLVSLAGMSSKSAAGVGLATVTTEDDVLDVWFPQPGLGEADESVSADLEPLSGTDPNRKVTRKVVTVMIEDLDRPPADPADAYLRLHLLSHRLVTPGDISVEGMFTVLNNVAWTDSGPCSPQDFEATRHRLRLAGQTSGVLGVDKFPRMTDYVIPSGVRVANADRVRLGAHLAEGTTVMHEGFVNFNAGTLGPSMVEGRISAGVVVGSGSDVGGGASIMGTLSGGGTEKISVGEGCLIGANAGLGISIGDNTIIEAGLYLTAGTIVSLPDGDTAKAREMSGISNMLFRRNSTTGAVEAIPRTGSWGGLNQALHAN